jgi:hypothetical protein
VQAMHTRKWKGGLPVSREPCCSLWLRISCPHCGSKNVEQEAAAFFAVAGKKS